ncbi:MAG: ATP-binding protein [Nitrososphaeraceae archaeon]
MTIDPSIKEYKIFDSIEDKFVARLREITATTRNTADGKATITFRTARIEAAYTPDIIKKIESGRLVAIPNTMSVGTNNTFSVYEIADIYPMHYSMLTLDRNQPGAIRKEFMNLIEKEWQKDSKSTWIEIVAAPTGYSIILDRDEELKFIRKNTVPLIGSQVHLLNKDTIQKFICYTPTNHEDLDLYTVGNLLGFTDITIPFTINLYKLLHYHVGVFAFTGSGKSNLTSLIMRKTLNSVPNIKFVIFDVSSEYGINALDLLEDFPSRILFSEDLRGRNSKDLADDYLRRHVVPERLDQYKQSIINKIEKIINQDKVTKISIESDAEMGMQQLVTYSGLLKMLGDIALEKYGAAGQKILILTIAGMIRKFMNDNKLRDDDSTINRRILPLLEDINKLLVGAKLRQDATILSLFNNIKIAIENPVLKDDNGYYSTDLVQEIMDEKESSSRLFVINLPEADSARTFCSEIINRVFRYRKNSFTLNPKIVFIFDEAQEFIPYDKRKEDGTDSSSKSVEKLLRHGRKYNLHGWISTQRIAHLNTNALQQLHSYFVSTMPRPYDRQLISDTFAIDDAFMDRTLTFENGDWLMTSFKATNTQNVPVFFHAKDNEDFLSENIMKL